MTGKPIALRALFVVAALTLGACTSKTSAPKQSTAVSAPTHAGSSASPASVDLTDYAANTDGPNSTVILTGAIGDYGTGSTVNPDGSVDATHTAQLKLALSQGSFRIDIAQLHSTFADAFTRQFPTNAGTCSGTVTVSAVAPIAAGTGTGAYAHASGSFNLTLKLHEVGRKPVCDDTGAFLAQTILITGSGSVSLS